MPTLRPPRPPCHRHKDVMREAPQQKETGPIYLHMNWNPSTSPDTTVFLAHPCYALSAPQEGSLLRRACTGHSGHLLGIFCTSVHVALLQRGTVGNHIAAIDFTVCVQPRCTNCESFVSLIFRILWVFLVHVSQVHALGKIPPFLPFGSIQCGHALGIIRAWGARCVRGKHSLGTLPERCAAEGLRHEERWILAGGNGEMPKWECESVRFLGVGISQMPCTQCCGPTASLIAQYWSSSLPQFLPSQPHPCLPHADSKPCLPFWSPPRVRRGVAIGFSLLSSS